MNRLLLTALGVGLGFATAANAELIYATTSEGRLVSFDSSVPGTLLSNVAITGLQNNETVVGIDFRPATGQLFALGSGSNLYTLNTTTGAASQVGAGGAFTLQGTSFGFDFNPTVDRIRVVSNVGQNLRLNPNNGALAATDTPVAFNGGGPNPGVFASAYTNNFAGAQTTTLYNIDANGNLYTQIPPNAGTLNLVGSLGVNFIGIGGFDISGQTGVAYAALTSPGANVETSNLFRINLQSGQASFISTIGSVDCATITGIAVVPEPGTIGAVMAGLVGLVGLRRRK